MENVHCDFKSSSCATKINSRWWGRTYVTDYPGVIEITMRRDREACRCIQAVRLRGAIYVLHAFQKNPGLVSQLPGRMWI